MKSRENPFLVQRQFQQAIRSLPREKKKLVAQIILGVVNDAKTMSIYAFKCKYIYGDDDND